MDVSLVVDSVRRRPRGTADHDTGRGTLWGVLIALVSDCYAPRLGGIEVHVGDLAAHLRTAGHTVRVITATPGEPEVGLLRLIPPVPLGVPINPWAGPALKSLLRGADVVHVHMGIVAPFAHQAASIAVEQGTPTVLTWHSLVAGSPATRVLAASWRAWVDAGAVPTAVSTVAAAQVAQIVHRPHVEVLRNGLDLARWQPDGPLPHPTDDGPAHLVSATRFAVRKRPGALIAMMARVRAAMAPEQRPTLTILGNGPWLAPLRQVVGRSSMRAWVDLPGRVPRADLLEIYGRADLYVAASRREAFGIAALEARTAGLPTAGYAGSGVADIVKDGVGGVLATSDADMVERLCALLSDRGRLRAMSVYHREHVLTAHDWPRVARDTLHTYSSMRRQEDARTDRSSHR